MPKYNGKPYFRQKKGVGDLLGILTERAVRLVIQKSIPDRLTYTIMNSKTIFGAMGNFLLGQKRVWDLLVTRYTYRKGCPMGNSKVYQTCQQSQL